MEVNRNYYKQTQSKKCMNFQVETDTTFVDLNNPNIITLDVDSEEFKQIINEEFAERPVEEVLEL